MASDEDTARRLLEELVNQEYVDSKDGAFVSASLLLKLVAAALQQARREERERCAKVAEAYDRDDWPAINRGGCIAAAIRSQGGTP